MHPASRDRVPCNVITSCGHVHTSMPVVMSMKIRKLIATGFCLVILVAGQALLVACQDGGEPVGSTAITVETPAPDLDETSVEGAITAFIGDVIASAAAGDGGGLAADSALSRLPRSLQSRLAAGEDSSVHDGLLEFLQVDTVPDGLLLVQLLEEDPLTKQARAQITLGFGDREELRIVELERTVCIARSRNQSAADECKANNLALYGDEEPWKITTVETP